VKSFPFLKSKEMKWCHSGQNSRILLRTRRDLN